MFNKRIAAAFAVTLLSVTACGSVAETAQTVADIASNKPSSGTVAALWSDVPLLDTAAKADLPLPAIATLAIRSVASGKFDFIAYSTSAKTPNDVSQFYTAELMKTNGWTETLVNCTTSNLGGNAQPMMLCAFKKKAAKEEVIAIIAMQDAKTSQTQIYYARVDMTHTPEAN